MTCQRTSKDFSLILKEKIITILCSKWTNEQRKNSCTPFIGNTCKSQLSLFGNVLNIAFILKKYKQTNFYLAGNIACVFFWEGKVGTSVWQPAAVWPSSVATQLLLGPDHDQNMPALAVCPNTETTIKQEEIGLKRRECFLIDKQEVENRAEKLSWQTH